MLDRQEHHADAVGAGLGQNEAELGALAGEELVRDLNQDAGAVAGFRIASASAAMGQVDEDLDPLFDNVVRPLAVEVHDEAHAAGVVLVAGVIQSLGFGRVTHDPEYLLLYYHVNRIYRLAILEYLMI